MRHLSRQATAFLRRVTSPQAKHWARQARSMVTAPLLRGEGRECPCCNGHFRRFSSYGIAGWRADDAMCPACGSLQRHRVLWLFLRDETPLVQRGGRLLHFAPERSLHRVLSGLQKLEYVTGDVEMAPLVDQRVDITSIPFEDGCFDWVLCSHVLEHVPRDDLALAEIRRVLKPGGVALLQHPVDPTLASTFEDDSVTDPSTRERVFGQADHVRIYGRDFIDRLRTAGLDADQIEYVERLPEADVTRYRLHDAGHMRSQDIYRCMRSED